MLSVVLGLMKVNAKILFRSNSVENRRRHVTDVDSLNIGGNTVHNPCILHMVIYANESLFGVEEAINGCELKWLFSKYVRSLQEYSVGGLLYVISLIELLLILFTVLAKYVSNICRCPYRLNFF